MPERPIVDRGCTLVTRLTRIVGVRDDLLAMRLKYCCVEASFVAATFGCILVSELAVH